MNHTLDIRSNAYSAFIYLHSRLPQDMGNVYPVLHDLAFILSLSWYEYN